MKLLFDQNVSPKLVDRLADLFPESVHVQTLGLDSTDDEAIWRFARENGLAIVSKDVDYNNMSIRLGWPPKVIWLLTGNCTTAQLEVTFRAHYVVIAAFENDDSVGTLALR